MRSKLLYGFLLFSILFIAGTTGHSQSIQLDFDDANQPFLVHSVEKGAGLYSIARKYLVALDDIYLYNNLLKEVSLKEGQNIKIPIDLKILFVGEDLTGYKYGTFTPVYYTLKAKETLYKVSKTYCSQEIKTFAKRNKLISKDLDIGTNLLIGWFPEDANEPILHTSIMSEEEDLEDSLYLDFDLNPINLVSKKGVAFWDKSSNLKSRKFALHKTAKINSEIALYNPLVKRTTTAKVIGRIPDDTYASNVSIIVSPATAASLGALDSRFMVELTYEE